MGGCYGPDDDERQPPWTRRDWILWAIAVMVGAALLYAWFVWAPADQGPKFPPDTVEGAAERRNGPNR
jgi:hypothetical protein